MSTALKPDTAKSRLASSISLIDSLTVEADILKTLPPMLEVLNVSASKVPNKAHSLTIPFCNEETFKKLPVVPLHNLPAGLTFGGVKNGSLASSTDTCRVLDVIRDLNGGCRWFTRLGSILLEVSASATSLDFSPYEESRIEGTSFAYYRQFLVAGKRKKLVAETREPLAVYEGAKLAAVAQIRNLKGLPTVRMVHVFNVLACNRLRNGRGIPAHVKHMIAAHNLSEEATGLVQKHVDSLPSMSLVDQNAYIDKEMARAQKWVKSFFRNVCTSQKSPLCVKSLNRMMASRLNSTVDLSIVSKAQRGGDMAYEYVIGFHFRSKYSSVSVKVDKATSGFPAYCWVTLSMVS